MAAKASRAPIENSPSTTVDNDAHSLQVSLPQMLDLALGTPEVGAVNLNILHNFLHVLLHQINLRATKVEYRGDEANRMKTVISTAKGGSSLQLHEYSITDSSSRTTQRKRNSLTEIGAQVYTHDGEVQDSSLTSGENGERTAASAPATARGTNGPEVERPGEAPAVKRTAGSKRQIGAGVNGESQSVIFVEPVLDGATPTALGFKKLEATVMNLQQRFEALDELAKNPEMIERVRSSKTDPLSDMWHVININKRLDACEKGIEKLATMLQDLIKGDKIESVGSAECDRLNERILDLENHLVDLSSDVANLSDAANTESKEIPKSVRYAPTADETAPGIPIKREDESEVSKVPSVGNNVEPRQVPSVGNELESAKVPSIGNELTVTKSSADAKESVDKKAPAGSNVKGKAPRSQERRSVIGGVDLTELKDDVKTLKSEIIELKKDLDNLNVKFVDVASSPRQTDHPVNLPVTSGAIGATASESTNLTDLIEPKSEPGISPSAESGVAAVEPITTKGPSRLSVKRTDSRIVVKDEAPSSPSRVVPAAASESHEHGIRDLQSRVTELEGEIGCINEKLNSEALRALGVDGNGGIDDLVAKILAIQEDTEKTKVTASRLMDDKENRELHTNALIEQIELLKTIKADKEDLEDALADKADAQVVNRKVSHDQFDAACDDLARGLEDAITKLSQQESVWQQALDEVQREIEGKLDKIEISPLKEFVNNRLKLLQEKLKALAEMKREREAAGTKKLLSDVQCISCDSNVVMRMEEGAHYRAPTLPSSKSIKPYLTYELDQVRRQQRRLPTSRNMIQFEAAMQEMARKSKPLKEELSTKSPRGAQNEFNDLSHKAIEGHRKYRKAIIPKLDHLCNRYCGGSHTITTPQQRVMRMGHFLAQWGPEAIQLTEGVIRGNDGQLYRSRAVPGKADAAKSNGEVDVPSDIPPPIRSSVAESVVASQRQSQVIRSRSSAIGALSRRASSRRGTDASKESSRNVEIPMVPSSSFGPPSGVSVDEGETVPELSGPIDEVVREASIDNINDEDDPMPEEPEV